MKRNKRMCVTWGLFMAMLLTFLPVQQVGAAQSEKYVSLTDDADAWMTWKQGDSSNQNVRKSGCRVTAFAMMFAEAGYAFDYANPTEFYNVLRSIKAISADCTEQGTYGSIAVNYAKHLGGKAKVSSRYNGSEKGILKLLEDSKGYYIILQANNSSKTHTLYVMRNRSLDEGKVWIADPATGTCFKYSELSKKYAGRTITYRGVSFSDMPTPPTEIEKKLEQIKAAYPAGTKWNNDNKYKGTAGCFAFAKLVFYELYGCDMSSAYSGAKKYLYGKETNIEKVGQLAEVKSSLAESDIKKLLTKVEAGDILQVGRYKSKSATATSPHTMVVLKTSDKGITVYHGNWGGKVSENYFTWAQFKSNFLSNPNNKAGVGVTVYRYKDK